MGYDEITEIFLKKMKHYDTEYHRYIELAIDSLQKSEYEKSSKYLHEADIRLAAWSALRQTLVEILA